MTIDAPSRPTPSNAPPAEPSVMHTRMRTIRPPQCYVQHTAFIAQAWDDVWDIQDFEIQEAMNDPIAFAATSNPDTLYYHEALKAPDRDNFIQAMQKEVQDHEDREHWELIP